MGPEDKVDEGREGGVPEQEQQFAGQRAESQVEGADVPVAPAVNPGKCPTCGRDR